MMTPEELDQAAVCYQEGGSFDPLYQHFRGYARGHALTRVKGSVYDADDCVQDQMLALYEAAKDWDPARGVPFEAFGWVRMRQAATRGAALNSRWWRAPAPSIWREDGTEKRELAAWDPPYAELTQFARDIQDEQERAVVFGRMAGMKFVEIGDLMGVSRQRVFQLWERAVVDFTARFGHDYA